MGRQKGITDERKKLQQQNKRDRRGNIKKETLEKIIDNIIERNPLIYERLAKI